MQDGKTAKSISSKSMKNNKVQWATEVKWTDRFFDRPRELKSLLRFCHDNNLARAEVTSVSKMGTRQGGKC